MYSNATMKKTPSSLDDYIAAQGRGNDTLLAHLSPREATILKKRGGSGSINPRTGMLEFFEGADSDGTSDTGMGDDGGGFGGADQGGESDTAMGGGGWGADQGGFADTAMGDPGTPGGFATGSHADVDADPNANSANPSSANFGSRSGAYDTTGDPLGMAGVMSTPGLSNLQSTADALGRFGKSTMQGLALTGNPLMGGPIEIGKAIYDGIKTGAWGKMSPEQQAEAIATAEGAMPSGGLTGGSDGGGIAAPVAAPTTTADSIAEVQKRRMIKDDPYAFNQQMVGLSNRDVPYVRRY